MYTGELVNSLPIYFPTADPLYVASSGTPLTATQQIPGCRQCQLIGFPYATFKAARSNKGGVSGFKLNPHHLFESDKGESKEKVSFES